VKSFEISGGLIHTDILPEFTKVEKAKGRRLKYKKI
jgi:hypothetical protein